MQWFDKNVKLFASELLAVIVLLWAYLEIFVAPRNKLPAHVRCYGLLRSIIGHCRCGAVEVTSGWHAQLRKLVDDHAQLLVHLYGEEHAKTKYHHLCTYPMICGGSGR